MLSNSTKLKIIKYTVFTLIGLTVLDSSYFIVEPTHMAGVRRLGTVQNTVPIGPGPHLKLPFIDAADVLQVSIDNFKIEDLRVYTIDNQPVIISVGVTYRIPTEAVMKLLYDVGKAGSGPSIMHNIEQVIADRTLKIFARRNTVKISEERSQISGEVREAVTAAVKEQFGMEIIDLQIPSIKYSDVFVASVEGAVKAKNDSIQAENTVNRIRYEGEQKVVTARAQAEVTVAMAEAAKKAKILEAEGNAESTKIGAVASAKSIELNAIAEAQSIKIRGDVLKDNQRVIDLTIAQRWSGQPPQTILGSASAVPFFSVNQQH